MGDIDCGDCGDCDCGDCDCDCLGDDSCKCLSCDCCDGCNDSDCCKCDCGFCGFCPCDCDCCAGGHVTQVDGSGPIDHDHHHHGCGLFVCLWFYEDCCCENEDRRRRRNNPNVVSTYANQQIPPQGSCPQQQNTQGPQPSAPVDEPPPYNTLFDPEKDVITIQPQNHNHESADRPITEQPQGTAL